MLRGPVTAVLLAGSVIACAEGEREPDAVGEHVELYLDDGAKVCAGQLQAYDRFIERAFDVWTGGSPEDFVARVHVTRDVPCTLRGSCAKPGNAWLGGLDGDFHELAHVVVESQDGWSNDAMTEGAAETLCPTHPFFSPYVEIGSDVLSRDIVDLSGTDYGALAVASRFLIARHGVDTFRSFYRTLGERETPTQAEIEQEFELSFGEPLDEVWTVLQSEPGCTFDLWYCDGEPTQALPLELDGFDCDDPGVTGYVAPSSAASLDSFTPRRIVQFRVDQEQHLEIEVAHVSATIISCGPCADRPPTIALSRDYEADPFELPFTAGTYAVVVRPFGDGPSSFSVRPVR